MSNYSTLDLVIIGIGAFILIRAVLGNYKRAFERDRRLGRFILSPFAKDDDSANKPGSAKYSNKDIMFITAGILAQVALLIIFIFIIGR